MTFGFYHSMITVPADLQEAATAYQLNRWQRFFNLELPSSAIGLVWNSMMSFGGGWFFVAQSEAITVLNKNIKLPGLGAYMATAAEQGDTRAALYAIAAMIVTIVVIDQLFWRPLVAWAEKFKFEQTGGGAAPTSWALDLLRRSYLVRRISMRVAAMLARASRRASMAVADATHRLVSESPALMKRLVRIGGWAGGGARLQAGSRSTRSRSGARSGPSSPGSRCSTSSGSVC